MVYCGQSLDTGHIYPLSAVRSESPRKASRFVEDVQGIIGLIGFGALATALAHAIEIDELLIELGVGPIWTFILTAVIGVLCATAILVACLCDGAEVLMGTVALAFITALTPYPEVVQQLLLGEWGVPETRAALLSFVAAMGLTVVSIVVLVGWTFLPATLLGNINATHYDLSSDENLPRWKERQFCKAIRIARCLLVSAWIGMSACAVAAILAFA